MTVDRNSKHLAMVQRGKYRRLYEYLNGLERPEWRASFGEIETVLGFRMPPSARSHRSWWGNQRGGSGHSHALAWSVAGWETAEVDMEAETLLFRRDQRPEPSPRMTLDELWPVHPTVELPVDLKLDRESIYRDTV